MKKQLTDAEGRVFVTVEHHPDLGITRALWSGEQTNETVRIGAEASLKLVRRHRSSKFLNDSSQVTGSWHQTNAWVAEQLFPKAVKAGLRYFAYVVAPSLEGKLSIVDLHQRVGDMVQMKVFFSPEGAEEWLQSLG